MNNSKWRVIIGLVLVYVAVLMNWSWVWGVLFLIWVLPDLLTGVTHFMETVERKRNPILYWFIIISWIWMSLFMVAIDVAPNTLQRIFPTAVTTQLIGEYHDDAMQIATTKASSTGTYQDKAIQSADFQNTGDNFALAILNEGNEEKMNYKIYNSKQTHYFVGVSFDMNINDPNLAEYTQALWVAFIENDISEIIPNIVDERVYFIYSNNDDEGNYKATIAYRTKDLEGIAKGLDGISVPASTFAVFEREEGTTGAFINKTWEKIYVSDLDVNDGISLEVYTFDDDYSLSETELRVSINATNVREEGKDIAANVTEEKTNPPSAIIKQEQLNYKTYNQTETQYFVGISAQMNINDPDLEKNTEALWNYFIENDISKDIKKIVDARVYFIYSDNDDNGNYKATLAYRTKHLNNIPEGLEGISIADSKFAVFEQEGGDSGAFIKTTWEKVYTSDLDMNNGTSLEVYTFDKNYNIAKTELRVAIN